MENEKVEVGEAKELVTQQPSGLSNTANNSMATFRRGVDNLLKKRDYFIQQVLPKLKENQDFYEIKGKKSLAKGGAEKLVTIYGYTADFEKDNETLAMLGAEAGLLAYVCNLKMSGVVVGQGRGADTVARNQNDPNKAIKMAQKRAYVDAVIRTTGLSDIFTQDLEDMSKEQLGDKSFEAPSKDYKASSSSQSTKLASQKQKDFIVKLLQEKGKTPEDLEVVIGKKLDTITISEASKLIDKWIAKPEESNAAKGMKAGMAKVNAPLPVIDVEGDSPDLPEEVQPDIPF